MTSQFQFLLQDFCAKYLRPFPQSPLCLLYTRGEVVHAGKRFNMHDFNIDIDLI